MWSLDRQMMTRIEENGIEQNRKSTDFWKGYSCVRICDVEETLPCSGIETQEK